MNRRHYLALAILFALAPMLAIAQDAEIVEGVAAPVTESDSGLVVEARDLFLDALKKSGTERLAGLRASFARLEKAADSDDQLPPALAMWGRLLLSAGDVRLARQALQQATSAHPESPDAYVLLGNLAAGGGQLAEARLCYNEAGRFLDEWPDTHPRRNALLAQIAAGRATVAQARSNMFGQEKAEWKKHYQSVALINLREWVKKAPENPDAHNQLAVALLQKGDIESAVDAFEKARELNPELPLTDLRLASAFMLKGDREQARARIAKAISAQPDAIDARLTAAQLLLSLGDTDLAREQIEKLQELAPNNTAIQLLEAQRQRYLGNWQAATEILQKLNADNPANFEVANLLALSQSEQETAEAKNRAVTLAAVNAQRFDDLNSVTGRRARITLTWTAFAAGQKEAAKQSLSQLLATGIASNQVSGDEAFYVARLLLEFGRPELAKTLLSNVLLRPEAFPKREAAEALLAQLQ